MTEREKYIKQNFEQWKEKYKFPDYWDFELEAMFGLQYDFINAPYEHVKNRSQLLDMILCIRRSLNNYFKQR